MTTNPAWNKERPYLIRWARLIDARLHSYSHRCETFITEVEAIEALLKPFQAYETDAHLCRFERIGFAPMIAKRSRGKKLRRMKEKPIKEASNANPRAEQSAHQSC